MDKSQNTFIDDSNNNEKTSRYARSAEEWNYLDDVDEVFDEDEHEDEEDFSQPSPTGKLL